MKLRSGKNTSENMGTSISTLKKKVIQQLNPNLVVQVAVTQDESSQNQNQSMLLNRAAYSVFIFVFTLIVNVLGVFGGLYAFYHIYQMIFNANENTTLYEGYRYEVVLSKKE